MASQSRQKPHANIQLAHILLALLYISPSNSLPSNDTSQKAAEKWQACVNSEFKFEPTTWDKAVHQEVLPRLRMERVWYTGKVQLEPLTIGTHTSYNRIYQLRAMCNSWGGPLVAAVHLGLLQEETATALNDINKMAVESAAYHLDRLFHRMEEIPRCQLSIVFVWEIFNSETARILYPYNTLRNYALVMAQTELVAMIDVDLLPSQNLFPELLEAEGREQNRQWLSQKAAVVLPAFETVPGMGGFYAEVVLSEKAIHGGKPALQALVSAGQVQHFHKVRYAAGHRATNYDHWFAHNDIYQIEYEEAYEPWFMLARAQMPWYDVRYRGYFYDKISYVAALHYAGFKYLAHPRAYLVHRPHPLTEALQSSLLPELQKIMFNKWAKVRVEMEEKTYVPVVDETFRKCAAVLPWYNGFQPVPSPVGEAAAEAGATEGTATGIPEETPQAVPVTSEEQTADAQGEGPE